MNQFSGNIQQVGVSPVDFKEEICFADLVFQHGFPDFQQNHGIGPFRVPPDLVLACSTAGSAFFMKAFIMPKPVARLSPMACMTVAATMEAGTRA